MSNYAGRLINLAVSILLTPFILNQLGSADYGLWIVAGSAVGYGYILELGIGGAVTKYVAEHRTRGEHQEVRTIIATALGVYLAMGLVIVCFAVIAAPLFPSLFGVPAEQRSRASTLFLLMGVTLGINIPNTLNVAVLQGLQRFEILSTIVTVSYLAYSAMVVLVLSLGYGLLGMVAINIPVALATQILAAVVVRRIEPEIRLSWRDARVSHIRKIASFSATLFANSVIERIAVKSDELVIAAFQPLNAVTPYALARRLSEMARTLTEQFLKLLPAVASELDAAHQDERLRQLYLAGTRLTLVLLLPAAACLSALAGPLLTLWVGAEYAVGAPVVVVLTTASVVATSQWPASLILQGMARHRPLAAVSLASALANLALSLLLVRPLGAVGVALGTLIPTTVAAAVFVIPYAARELHVSVRTIARQVLFPSVTPAVPTLAVLHLCVAAMQPSTIFELAGVSLLGASVYGATYLVIGATDEERRVCRGLLRAGSRVLCGLGRKP